MQHRAMGTIRAVFMIEPTPPEITLSAYFGIYANHPDASAGKWSVADMMLEKVNALLRDAVEQGIHLGKNPQTGTLVAGTQNGGFRPADCKVGAPLSKHKTGHAVDVYDPDNKLDDWLTDETLSGFHLWREATEATPGWCHLADVPPKSGARTFLP